MRSPSGPEDRANRPFPPWTGATRLPSAVPRQHVPPPPIPVPADRLADAVACRTPGELMDTFATAFGRGEIGRVADCYTTPSFVVTNARTVTFGSRAEVVDGFTTVIAQYRASGLSSVGYEMHRESPLTPNLIGLSVEWRHRDGGGRIRFRDRYRYILRREDDVLRIHVAIVVGGADQATAPAVR